jgi:glycosyltransferase involved in cell wall biosynthesis
MTRHLITPEYPPQPGGVSDYTHLVAAGLAAQGEEVHVWCPAHSGNQREAAGVVIHRELGTLTPSDLLRSGRRLNQFTAPRRILVQWVPHGYGYRSMNLAFCLWLLGRSVLRGDDVEIMVHEPYLAFGEGTWRQNLVAMIHRFMTVVLFAAVKRVWMSIPAWEACLRPYTLGRRIPFRWLPVPSNVRVVDNPADKHAVRQRYAGNHSFLIGHFGTYGSSVTSVLEPVLFSLCDPPVSRVVLLMGNGSEKFRRRLLGQKPQLAGVLHATGALNEQDLSCHVAACDLLLQPYSDGVSGRRGSTMVGLAHGKPVVTTNGHLTEPLWRDSSALALAPAGDVKAMVQLVEELEVDPRERARLGQAARRLYQERFDISHTISELQREPDGLPQTVCAS